MIYAVDCITQSALYCVNTTLPLLKAVTMLIPCRAMMGAYKINVKEIGLSAGLKQWYKMLKQRTSLEFEALPDADTSVRVSIRINVRLNLSMCFQEYAASTTTG